MASEALTFIVVVSTGVSYVAASQKINRVKGSAVVRIEGTDPFPPTGTVLMSLRTSRGVSRDRR